MECFREALPNRHCNQEQYDTSTSFGRRQPRLPAGANASADGIIGTVQVDATGLVDFAGTANMSVSAGLVNAGIHVGTPFTGTRGLFQSPLGAGCGPRRRKGDGRYAKLGYSCERRQPEKYRSSSDRYHRA